MSQTEANLGAIPKGSRAPEPAKRHQIVILGNPNTGKSTLFNRLTGQNARVGNYPGVTVEKKSGTVALPSHERAGQTYSAEITDVPGCYSLSARSLEEQIALSVVLGEHGMQSPEVVVVVIDASQLYRGLYLALQLLELRAPVVVAVNMMDEARDNPPNCPAIAQALGVPCVGLSARTGEGVDALKQAMADALEKAPKPAIDVPYPEALRGDIDRVAEALPASWRDSVEHDRALAAWALTSIDRDDELSDIDTALRERVLNVHDQATGRDLDREIIQARYSVIERLLPGFFERPLSSTPKKHPPSERIDRVLLHPVYGFLLFLALMLVLFQALFAWSDPAIGVIESGVGLLQGALEELLPEGFLTSLVTEGVVGGVGNVIVFLPQILLLFLFLGLLEDSGYMARVAFLMDRIMRTMGLHGRAFVPMLSGFACAVPAIMGTRTMERQRDRLLTMLVIPLMTCSARLPVYTLVIAALFPPTQVFGLVPVQGLLMVSMYVFSMLISLLAAYVLGRTVVKGRSVPLILELPQYRKPRLGSILRMMWQRSSLFLKEAGGMILVCTVILWVLLSYPKLPEAETLVTSPLVSPIAQQEASGTPASPATGEPSAQRITPIEYSYGGRIGKALEPLIEPLGFDWKIGIGLLGAFSAREVFVSTMGLVYGIGDVDDNDEPLRERIRSETKAGKPAYTPLVGLSLMVFFALACQCMSTLAVVRRETGGYRWPLFLFVYMTALAYAASLLVFQVGRALGF